MATRLIVTTEKTGPHFVALFSFNGHYTQGVLRSASHLNCNPQLTLLRVAEQLFLFSSDDDFCSQKYLMHNINNIITFLIDSRWNEECPNRQLDSSSLSEWLILLLTLKIIFKQTVCIQNTRQKDFDPPPGSHMQSLPSLADTVVCFVWLNFSNYWWNDVYHLYLARE